MRKVHFTALFLAVTLSVDISAAETEDYLDVYVEVATGLAADNLEPARQAARKLSEMAEEAGETALSKQASAVSKAPSINEAREEFKGLSARLLPMAKGRDGYYIMNCPMTENGDWVQKDPQVANPYFGETMLHCGSIVDE